MRIPKRYGQSRTDKCPICKKQATTENHQKIPVCTEHKHKSVDIKCVCGSYLEPKHGKFGAYFHCMNCGNVSMSKALSMK